MIGHHELGAIVASARALQETTPAPAHKSSNKIYIVIKEGSRVHLWNTAKSGRQAGAVSERKCGDLWW